MCLLVANLELEKLGFMDACLILSSRGVPEQQACHTVEYRLSLQSLYRRVRMPKIRISALFCEFMDACLILSSRGVPEQQACHTIQYRLSLQSLYRNSS
jgi:hypothetical protein